MIISASRRTDIPAFYSDWFINRLTEGYVLSRNPMNYSQVSKINLAPDLTDCIVFWTKDPKNLLDKLTKIDDMGYRYYFQFTLTPYGMDIEKNLRDKKEIVETFQQLSIRLGKNRVLWRYDPIILNNQLTSSYHIEQFEHFCEQLSGYSRICTISFVDMYAKLEKNVKNKLIRNITDEEMFQIAEAFSGIGRKYDFEIRACCEALDLTRFGIKNSSCIDQETIEAVCGYGIDSGRDGNQRTGCGCMQSIDIGAYNTCRHNCIYCYANYNEKSVQSNCLNHHEKGEFLIGRVRDIDIIKERKVISFKK